MEADPGTWCKACAWDWTIRDETFKVEGAAKGVYQELDLGLSQCLSLNLRLSLSETRPALALWLQAFQADV